MLMVGGECMILDCYFLDLSLQTRVRGRMGVWYPVIYLP